MTPHTLTVSAFGSLHRKTVINFDALYSEKLFLISGDAAAGKTTLFDALHFALFGEASNKPVSRSESAFRARNADSTEETSVELTFSHNGTRYRVTRSPAYKRSKLRGSGDHAVPASAVLCCEDTGETVTDLAEVNRCISDIFGSTDGVPYPYYLRGTEGVLSILTENDCDLTTLIRSLFGIDQYIEMEKALKISAEEHEQQLHAFDTVILRLLRKIEPVSDSDRSRFGVYRSDIRHLPLAIRELHEMLCRDNASLAIVIQQIRDKNEQLRLAARKLESSKQYYETETKLNAISRRQRQLSSETGEIERLRQRLDKDACARRIVYARLHLSPEEGEKLLLTDDISKAISYFGIAGVYDDFDEYDAPHARRDDPDTAPTFAKALKSVGFTSEKDWYNAFLPDHERDELKKKVASHDDETAAVKRRIKQLREQLKTIPSNGRPEALQQYSTFKKELSGLEKERRRIEKRINAHSIISDMLDDYVQKRGELDKVASQAAAEYRAVAGIDSGISLELSELGRVFEDCLSRANRAYAVLTDGSLALCRAGKNDPQMRAVLYPEVVELVSGTHFSIDSLSENELLLAALALRIGISEALCAGTVKRLPDTIFLDNCFFAASDEEKRHIAAVLKDFAAHGPIIGLIERTGTLDECIRNRITVTKGADGSSVQIHTDSET